MKKKNLLFGLVMSALVALSFTGCSDDNNDEPTNPTEKPVPGIFVLNSGKYKGNNGSVSFYNIDKNLAVADTFTTINGRGLGDTPNDMIMPLRECSVSAAELMDRNALRAVENDEGMPEILKSLPDEAVALLIDTSANDEATLQQQFAEIEQKLSSVTTLYPISFTTDPKLYATYWNVRSGLFTSAAAGRPKGTVSIIEDIAFRGEILGDALTDVREVLAKHHYPDAVMWGHLLDGNVHFTIFPDINKQEGVDGYAKFMS